MKTIARTLMVILAGTTMALPAFAAVNMGSMGGEVLTLADFQRTVGGKPIQALERYRQYKYQVSRLVPKAALDVSTIRKEPKEKTLADFKRVSGNKPIQAWEQYRRFKYGKSHPAIVKERKPLLKLDIVSSGKPAVDWWKYRHE